MPPKRNSISAKASAKRQAARRATAVKKARDNTKERFHKWDEVMARDDDGTLTTVQHSHKLPSHRQQPRARVKGPMKMTAHKGVLDAGKPFHKSTWYNPTNNPLLPAHTGPRRPASYPQSEADQDAYNDRIRAIRAARMARLEAAAARRRLIEKGPGTGRAPKSAAKRPVKKLPVPKKRPARPR